MKIFLTKDELFEIKAQEYERGLKDAKSDIRPICLTIRESVVLYLRWGEKYSLEKVGKILKVTRERIRQIESKAIRKLRYGKILFDKEKDFKGKILKRRRDESGLKK